MALGSTQPLTEIGTRSISWVKSGRCVRLTTLPPYCAVVTKSGILNFLEPCGPLLACNGTALPLPFSSFRITGLEVNVDKTKYMAISRDQNGGRSHSIKIDNSSFGRVEQFKYLGHKLNKSKLYSRRN